MRCYLGENYIPFSIPTENRSTSVKVTSDITEVARTVQILLYITHGDDVIGKTNRVEIKVFATKAGTPLAPREEFDEIIRQQRATIAEHEETISDQAEIIQANERTISGLNTQVSTLTAQNDSLANQNETSRETIQYMIDHPPTPQLETPDPVTPTAEQQTIRPSEGYDGLTSVVVNGSRQGDLQKFLARGIDFELEIEADTIGDYLCYKQTGMTSCRLTGSPASIGVSAFLGCTSLQRIDIPDSVASIGNNAFSSAGIVELILPNGLAEINPSLCDSCNSLRSATIPNSVTTISYNAFSKCGSLQTINIPNSVTIIGNNVFWECGSLQTINIPNSVTTIGNNAFYACRSLRYLTIENGFNCNNLNVSASINYSADTIVSWLNALADRTGLTAFTLTIGSTNLAKLTAEQIAIATNKNWNLA